MREQLARTTAILAGGWLPSAIGALARGPEPFPGTVSGSATVDGLQFHIWWRGFPLVRSHNT